MIEVRDLSKRYGSHHAVQGLSFDVQRGEIVGFLGPNGAGKSTTLRMLTGFLAPTDGRIRIDGVDAIAHPVEARRRIGYMPEACPLYPEMRVGEYLRYRAELKGVARKKIAERVEIALQQAAVADVAQRIVGQLSKGYRQRVGLADALVADPPLLVLDEPTAGLDPNQIRQVRELITKLAKDKTVLVSTHILPEVEATCDRVLILHKGKLVSEGRTDELRARAQGDQSVRVVTRGRAGALAKALEGLALLGVEAQRGTAEGYRDDAEEIATARVGGGAVELLEQIFRRVVDAGLVLRELKREEASLEDVFAHLTTAEKAPAAELESEDEDEDESEDEDEESEDEDESEDEEDDEKKEEAGR